VVVKVLFFGVLKDLTGLSEETVEVAPATTIEELFDRYAQRFETLKAARPSILLARNREFSNPDTPLTDHDEIAFLPPVSGGSTPRSNAIGEKAGFLSLIEDESGSLFALTRQPIESQAWAGELQRAMAEGLASQMGRPAWIVPGIDDHEIYLHQPAKLAEAVSERLQLLR